MMTRTRDSILLNLDLKEFYNLSFNIILVLLLFTYAFPLRLSLPGEFDRVIERTLLLLLEQQTDHVTTVNSVNNGTHRSPFFSFLSPPFHTVFISC
jgi:hypothetical protein